VKETPDLTFHFVFFFSHQLKLPDKLHKFIPVQVGFFRKFGRHFSKNLSRKDKGKKGI
jgi:hypothetical protein